MRWEHRTDGTAAEVEVIAGAGQRAPVTTELPEPVVVRLVDAEGRAVARHPVRSSCSTGRAVSSPKPIEPTGAATTRHFSDLREPVDIHP